MYYDFLVKVLEQTLGITQKNIKGTTYIYYSYNHKYSSEKKYTVPRATTIPLWGSAFSIQEIPLVCADSSI